MSMQNRIKNKINFTKNITFLGNGLLSKLKIPIIIFWISLRDKVKLSNKSNFTLDLKIFDKNFKFTFMGSHSELLMIEEIMCRKSYDMDADDPKIILDLGANIGIASVYFALKYPNSTVLSFEPNPDIFNTLQTNTSYLKNIKTFQFAISDKKDKIVFFKNIKHNSSSLNRRFKDDREIFVDSMSLDDLINDLNLDFIDILKFDIEGSEFIVFKNFKNWNNIKNIIGEIHEDLSQSNSFDLLSKLQEEFNLQVEDGGKKGRFIVKGYKND